MKATKKFTSYEQYEIWTEKFDNCSDYEEIPTLIDDGWKLAMDMFVECKSYKTALRRFAKAFGCTDENAGVKDWIEGMTESCESGYFSDTAGWHPAWTNDPEEIRKAAEGGTYSWGVEELDEGRWYIFLNISGIYANRER